MSGYLGLFGGDEFRPGCEDFDRALLAAVGVLRPKVLVVPTAAAKENPAKAAANGVGYFSELGADAYPLMVLDTSSANDSGMADEVIDANLIYITGGDPAHLLGTLNGSLVLAEMLSAVERDAAIAGSSAGAMVMGNWMRFRRWRRALGIAQGVAVLPHHERAESSTVSQDITSDAPDGLRAVLGICGLTGCLKGPTGGWAVHGPGDVTVYRDGDWDTYGTGQVFVL